MEFDFEILVSRPSLDDNPERTALVGDRSDAWVIECDDTPPILLRKCIFPRLSRALTSLFPMFPLCGDSEYVQRWYNGDTVIEVTMTVTDCVSITMRAWCPRRPDVRHDSCARRVHPCGDKVRVAHCRVRPGRHLSRTNYGDPLKKSWHAVGAVDTMPLTYVEWMRKSPEERRAEMEKRIRRCTDGKDRVAVVLTAHGSETPVVPQFRYLMGEDDTVATLMQHIRKQLVAKAGVDFHEQSALFLFVKDPANPKRDALLSGSLTMSELRADYVGDDGFVHVLYATENVFG